MKLTKYYFLSVLFAGTALADGSCYHTSVTLSGNLSSLESQELGQSSKPIPITLDLPTSVLGAQDSKVQLFLSRIGRQKWQVNVRNDFVTSSSENLSDVMEGVSLDFSSDGIQLGDPLITVWPHSRNVVAAQSSVNITLSGITETAEQSSLEFINAKRKKADCFQQGRIISIKREATPDVHDELNPLTGDVDNAFKG